MLSILLLLAAGHIFTDFFLQTTRLGTYKRKNILALTAHALTWASALTMVLVYFDLFFPWKFHFLFASHFLIDWLKIKLFKASLPRLHPVNITDQLMHFATILVVLLV